MIESPRQRTPATALVLLTERQAAITSSLFADQTPAVALPSVRRIALEVVVKKGAFDMFREVKRV